MEENKIKDTKRPRLVLVPCPYQGHINPMLHLGSFLHENGFSITIAHTFFNSLDPSQHPHFDFFRLHDGLSNDAVSTWDVASILLALNVTCSASLEAAMAVAEEEGSGAVVCIIYDELMYFCEAVANRMRIRGVVFRTTSAATSLARCGLLALHSQGRFPVLGSTLQDDQIPELHPLRFKDLPLPMTSDFFKYTQIISNMYNITTASAVIWNTIAWLEESELIKINNKNSKIPIFPIGPTHKITSTASASLIKEDSKCLVWLDKQTCNSVIYVSVGSLAQLTHKEVKEMAWGLASSRHPFLWVIRPGSVCGSGRLKLMPRGFEEEVGERGCVVEWAPQKEVLAHRAVGGFWSHCGWNSTLESLGEGVPMLCMPCSGDQRVNARYICHVWKVGLELEGGLERKKIKGAIRRLMVEEGRKMRERAMDFKGKFEESVKEGSSSCKLKELVSLIKSFRSKSLLTSRD